MWNPAADPNFDPVAASKEDRKARKLKNESQRLKNLQRAAATEASNKSAAPAKNALAEREIRKKVIERELKITKTSTASMGKFDAAGKGETKEKNIKRKVSQFRDETNELRSRTHSRSLPPTRSRPSPRRPSRSRS